MRECRPCQLHGPGSCLDFWRGSVHGWGCFKGPAEISDTEVEGFYESCCPHAFQQIHADVLQETCCSRHSYSKGSFADEVVLLEFENDHLDQYPCHHGQIADTADTVSVEDLESNAYALTQLA